jgi:hypothetical protein
MPDTNERKPRKKQQMTGLISTSVLQAVIIVTSVSGTSPYIVIDKSNIILQKSQEDGSIEGVVWTTKHLPPMHVDYSHVYP